MEWSLNGGPPGLMGATVGAAGPNGGHRFMGATAKATGPNGGHRVCPEFQDPLACSPVCLHFAD
eukprot:9174783-Lingulodinium_polyedra.AAC.1